MYHFQTYLNVLQSITTTSLNIFNNDDTENKNDNDETIIDNSLIKDDRVSYRNLEFVCEIYGFVLTKTAKKNANY